MKKLRTIWLICAAGLALAACSRVQMELPESEVSFQVAGLRPATKAPEDYKNDYQSVPFGAYAWFKGQDPADNTSFMLNQEVAYDASGNRWVPVGTTYYWPKSGSLDFICYSPYAAAGGPVIGENTIDYNGWDVSAHPTVDLLYADKAEGLRNNTTTYAYSGVPVLFRHALSRLRFTVRMAYTEVTASTGDKTKWEVDVNSITLKDIRTTGSLSLEWEGGLWKKPASGAWTPDGTKEDIALDCSALQTFADTTPQEVGESFLVLPQPLDLGQRLVFNLTIRTWRDTGSGYPVAPFITETAIEVAAGLDNVSLPAWGINQYIHYTLTLTPSHGANADPSEITFDPAVADWDTIDTHANINI